MIIWINGAFGAGKTTVSELLVKRIPDAMVYDPELMGQMLRRIVPRSPTGDFQDLPIWRDMVGLLAVQLRRRYARTLIVPMTLVNPDYLREIFGTIQNAGETLCHFFLDADRRTLAKRITNQIMEPDDPVRDAEIRAWRLAQIERCLMGRATLPARTVFLDTVTLIPEAVTEQILATLFPSGR